ncbi:MAG: DUF3109 family protein [Sphingomonadales bacterium]|nr:DUF3109 family protein [Sphingomonadales bacterium]
MIFEHQGVLISKDILDEYFVCSLALCKGACCEEGELGAPLEEEELGILQKNLEHILPFLPPEAVNQIRNQGFFERDPEGEPVTQTLGGRACVFAYKDAVGVWKCGIEKSWKQGQSHFRKPISCHLYPIRVNKLHTGEALHYHRWNICASACQPQGQGGIRLYQFVKDALIRRYGQNWYDELEEIASVLPDQG